MSTRAIAIFEKLAAEPALYDTSDQGLVLFRQGNYQYLKIDK